MDLDTMVFRLTEAFLASGGELLLCSACEGTCTLPTGADGTP